MTVVRAAVRRRRRSSTCPCRAPSTSTSRRRSTSTACRRRRAAELSLQRHRASTRSGHERTLQVAPIPWDKEARFRLPVQTWHALMDHYYPNSAWLRLRRDIFERLSEFKRRHGIPDLGRGARAAAARRTSRRCDRERRSGRSHRPHAALRGIPALSLSPVGGEEPAAVHTSACSIPSATVARRRRQRCLADADRVSGPGRSPDTPRRSTVRFLQLVERHPEDCPDSSWQEAHRARCTPATPAACRTSAVAGARLAFEFPRR